MNTTINGKEIKLFRKQDVEMVFTNKVNEFLAQGFYFNMTEGARGHQGEEMKVCLTNDGGKTAYLIFVDREYGRFSDNSPDAIVIYVKKYEDAERGTLWIKEGEEVWKKTFYAIERTRRYGKEVYVESLDEFKLIQKIQEERFNKKHNLPYEKELPESTRRIAVNILRKKKGYKATLLKDVTRVVRRRTDNALIAHIVGKGSAFLDR